MSEAVPEHLQADWMDDYIEQFETPLEGDEEVAIRQFLNHTQSQFKRQTLRNRMTPLKQFTDFQHKMGRTLFEVEPLDVEDWMDSMLGEEPFDKYSPRTVRQKMYAVSSAYNRFVRRGYVDEHPFDPLKEDEMISRLEATRRGEERDSEYLEVEEYEAMLEACDDIRNEVVLRTLWNLGCRVQEAVEIRVDLIDREDRAVEVPQVKQGKYSESDTRRVYYQPAYETLLQKWLDRGERDGYWGARQGADAEYLLVTKQAPQMAVTRINEIVHKVAEKAGIQEKVGEDVNGRPRYRVHAHLFRKSFAVHRVKNGCPLVYIADSLGHEDVEVTRDNYLQYRDDDRKEAMDDFAPHG